MSNSENYTQRAVLFVHDPKMPANIIATQSLYCKRCCSAWPTTLLTPMGTIPNLYTYHEKNSGRKIASRIIISVYIQSLD